MTGVTFYMTIDKVKKLNLPSSPGCYQFFNKDGELIYIGKAANLKSRVTSYWLKSATHSPAKSSMLKLIAKIKLIATDSEIEALLLEANLIKKYRPPYNVVMRDDKRHLYIKISLDDEIPGVFITRKLDKSGKYFGPFVSAEAARETLKTIRKIWPYCAEKKYQKKPCFYYQINLCTGICNRLIDRKTYLSEIIKPIILFFEGKKKKIIKRLEVRILKLEKKLKKIKTNSPEFEETETELARLNFKLLNINKVLEHANILGIGEKYANDVVELAKILGLKKVPERIEGYDIANIFGREAVGSMVVFSGGEADKSEYRKFKIKIGEGQANDTRMLKEILDRRFKHFSPVIPAKTGIQKKKDWPLPDLMIVDGGKPQLNAALSVLKKHKKNIALIAISKGEGLRSSMAPDKLFFPGEKKPLELPLASPALHLIKRVRNEAHRFAIAYHRKIRAKKFFE